MTPRAGERLTIAEQHAAWKHLNDRGLGACCRAEFEAWARRQGRLSLDRIRGTGHYDQVGTKSAWQIWQAAWEAAKPVL